MVKYKGQIKDNIRKLYKKNPLISNKNKIYSKDELRKSELNKPRAVPSAVHIASAIAAYARILINDYKNIPGNPCVMSDTDSAVLPYPLPLNLVGKGLGQMKLVSKINEGILIRKKLYCIIDSNNQEIIKSSGVASSRLNYESFKKLLNGESIVIERTNFNVDWKTLNIDIINSNIVIQGLSGEVKTIYNTTDVNFKSIIIHPLFPIENINTLNSSIKENTILEKEKDNDDSILFSKLEIIFFLISLILIFILIFIYIYFYK